MNLNDASLDITCPHCGQKGSETLGGLQAKGYTCPGCGLIIEADSDQFRQAIDAAQKALSDFAARLKGKVKG